MSGYEILQGDCRLLMQDLAPASVDLVVTDPPYGITSLAWDRAVDGWLDEVVRVLKPSGSVWMFGSLRSFIGMTPDFVDWNIAQDIVWEKHNGSNFHADRFRRVHELAIHLYQGNWRDIYRDPQYTADATHRTVRRKKQPPHLGSIEKGHYVSHDGGPRHMRSVMKVRSCHGEALHPTQKPLAILTPLIRYSCPPGGVVLDPFAGSGSTLVAAVSEGRQAIGIEIDEHYVDVCHRRLSSVQVTLPLDATTSTGEERAS